MTWLSWINWLDAPDALITPDDEAGELIALNLKRRQASSAWRTLGDEAGFTVDFGKAREIGAVALVFPRENDPAVFDPIPAIGASDTVRHRLSATTPGAGDLYDSSPVASGVHPAFGYHVRRLPDAVNARYWRVDIDAPSRTAEGFIDVVRAWAGPVFAPTVNFSYGDNSAWQAAADITRARRGSSEYSEAADALQAWSLSFDGISDTERDLFEDFEQRVTAAQQFLIVRDDKSPGREAILARQASAGGIDSVTWRRNRKQLRMIENI